MSKLILIDGNSIAFRAFFALPLLSNSSGLHTNAVFGFTTMLLRLMDEQKPTHFLVAFDAGKVTFRHSEYKEYKGGRAKTPPELSEQFPLIRELLKAFSIPQYELAGYEADDIIGTLTRMADDQGMEVIVVSGDKDMLQLASDNVKIAITRKGISEVDLYDKNEIKEKYGLSPLQIIDLKGLMGDKSDNIPGVPGVGEKTAIKLLQEYGSVEEVLAHVGEITGKMGEKIAEHADNARMSKSLATIFREVPLEQTLEQLQYDGYDGQAVATLFRKLEFRSLIDKMDLSGGVSDELDAEQESLTWATAALKPDPAIDFEISLTDLVAALPKVQAIHVESIGDNPNAAELIGLSFYSEAQTFYLPVSLLLSNEATEIRKWLADDKIPKKLYDLHRSEIVMGWKGIEIKGVKSCILLAAYLLDPTETSHTLHSICSKYGVSGIRADEDIYGKGAKFILPQQAALSEHLCRKANVIYQLADILEKELEKNEMSQLYHDLELPLSTVLASMELKGIKVNKDELKKLGEQLAIKLDELIIQIHQHAGGEFNINSPKQMGEILFDRLKLPVYKKTKTGYSTNVEVLEWLESKHDIVKHILLYRQLAKLQSTYVEGLLKEIKPATGKIHTYFKQTIAATGRLSSQFPNLQNIPVRLEEGRKIRKVFVPHQTGWSILAADYSQIELRVLAHISQDENMMEAFHTNLDIHTKTAMDVFGVEASAVDSNMRRQAKAVNFGIVYGISDYGLSQNLDITRADAAKFIEQYFAVFQGVRRYMDDIVKQARQDGFVTTMLKRRRYLTDIAHSNFNLRSFAERTAMNTPIQGTAADIIKLAMVQMDERLRQEKLASRMLLQVHDELVFEVPLEEMEIMQRIVPEVMEHALELSVPMKVDVNSGASWYEAK
ncbi:DNA polymerase I [Paenibacillus psychroresistens]|uniref:DNA polymerase I n=1 Tax=Paenibacillus psychroresistens TaxID=1778678 RepID=A0A6B8RNH4_9BACL|nr:DNA polymerase I [Paenibacillus psychroresistens]QGQ97579.1 DNA polymerase I [Paenibacillus psychroresistens]